MDMPWIWLPLSVAILGFLFEQSGSVESTVPDGLYQAGGCRVSPGRGREPNRCCDGWEPIGGDCVRVCPPGYTRNTLSGCYRLVQSARSWAESRWACQQESQSDLVVIDSQKELDLIVLLARDLSPSVLWIGLREAPLVRSLVWVDGSQVDPMEYITLPLLWTRPSPALLQSTGVLPRPPCVGVNLTSGALEWRPCNTPAAFLCETRSQCPRGFEEDFHGHCYRYATQRPLPWHDARNDCRRAPGGELVILADDEPWKESQFLLQRVRPNADAIWIGLYDETSSGTWKWVDGTRLTTTQGVAWNAGKPHNPSGRENCAGIDLQSRWTNADCGRSLPYVCEIQESGECYTSVDGSDYQGHVNITITGNQCSYWTRDSLSALNVHFISDADWLALGGHNYCRNPGGVIGSPWCIEVRGDGSVARSPCYVGEPQVSCVKEVRPVPRSFATPCTDRRACDSGHTCHPAIRQCICPSGYKGALCRQPCDSGQFGYGCDFSCPTCPNGAVCNHVTGECPQLTRDTDVTDSLDGEPPLPCDGVCLVAVRVGCVCDVTSGSCPCPAYMVALLAIFIAAWVVLGVTCLACGIIRRRRNFTGVEYKRDSDYCEEIGSESETDDELNIQQISGHPTSDVVSEPVMSSAVGAMENFESSTTTLLPETPQTRPTALPTAPSTTPHQATDSPPDESPPPSPFYLNVTRYHDKDIDSDYSDPYELLGREPLWRRSAPGPDEIWEPFLFRPAVHVAKPDERNKEHNGYINDSVIRLKEKRRNNKGGHMPYRLRFSFRSKELDNKAAASVAGETPIKRTFKQKPPIKPKPDSIKIRPYSAKGTGCGGRGQCGTGTGTFSRRSDPQSSCITRRDELELQLISQHSPRMLPRHTADTRRHKLQRGTSVPGSTTDTSAVTAPWPWRDGERSTGHVYVNEKIGRPRVTKARSVDEFGSS